MPGIFYLCRVREHINYNPKSKFWPQPYQRQHEATTSQLRPQHPVSTNVLGLLHLHDWRSYSQMGRSGGLPSVHLSYLGSTNQGLLICTRPIITWVLYDRTPQEASDPKGILHYKESERWVSIPPRFPFS